MIFRFGLAATSIVVMVLSLAFPRWAGARDGRQSQIPAAPALCDTCHLSGGGSLRNAFGSDVEDTLTGGPPLDLAVVDWPSVCRKDSDDDGASNGAELGDPNCVWQTGDPPPPPPLYDPADPSVFPPVDDAGIPDGGPYDLGAAPDVGDGSLDGGGTDATTADGGGTDATTADGGGTDATIADGGGEDADAQIEDAGADGGGPAPDTGGPATSDGGARRDMGAPATSDGGLATDASSSAPDAGRPRLDDGGPEADAGSLPEDTGEQGLDPREEVDDGCSCQTPRAPSGREWLAMLAPPIVYLVRLRRRA